jgi:phytanoyl-CoA hydroxylase
MLSKEQQDQYRRDGYLVIRGFKDAAAIAALRQRALQIVDDFDPAEGSAIFTTRNQAAASDDWFLGSDNTVRCFFEEAAFAADGTLNQAKALSINKIGHAMHDLDPVFGAFARDPRLAAIARASCATATPSRWNSSTTCHGPTTAWRCRSKRRRATW